MELIKLQIHLKEEDKHRPEVVELLARESGNSKEELAAYLRTHDVITVPNMPSVRAVEIVKECSQLGVTATMGDRVEGKAQRSQSSLSFGEGLPISWNWWAFFFTFLWYAFKGLWVKLSVYIMASWLIKVLPLPLTLEMLLQLAFWVYIGMFANYDLYLHREEQERLWPKVPFSKWKKHYIVCCVLFVIFGITLPVYNTVVGMIQGMQTVLNMDDRRTAEVAISDTITFTAVPNNWWTIPNPVKGFTMKSERRRGRKTQTIEYTVTRHTKMASALCTNPLSSPMGTESMGVAAIELFKPTLWRKYKALDDPALVKEVTQRYGIRLPLFLKWMKRFITMRTVGPQYATNGQQTWGASTIIKEVRFADQKLSVFTDVYWTIVEGELITVVSECFPEYTKRVRREVHNVLASMRVNGVLVSTPAPPDAPPPEPTAAEPVAKKEAAPPAATVDEVTPQETTVAAVVQNGLAYLNCNDREKARACLREAVARARNIDDLADIERLKAAMGE